MNFFLNNSETEPNSEKLFFGEFIISAQTKGVSDSLKDLESESNVRAVRNGVMLPGAITVIFMSVVYWHIGSSSFLLTGIFMLAMLLFAYAVYALGYRREFSIILCFMVMGATAILSILNRDAGGVFINGLSIFLLMGAFLFSPRLYYFSLIPVVATIFFQYLDGPFHILGIVDDGYNTFEKTALTSLWMVVFVAIAQVIRRNFFTTLNEIVSLNKELESAKESLLVANHDLDDLNKSLEDRIDERTSALQEALIKAEAANVAKDRFFATISHEFRTPLNAIIGYSEGITEILDDEGPSAQEEVAHSAENVVSAGKNLLSLVNDVLEISQLEAGDTSVQVGKVDLDKLANDLRVLVTPMIEQNQNRFKISNHTQTDSIYTDEKKFERILINLLSNAAKFTEKGHIELIISDLDEDRLMFEVRDDGVGISADKLEMIFEPFKQAEDTNPYGRQYGGVGLGLAICKRLSSTLNSELLVTSDVGQGTSFKLSVPKEFR